MKRYCQHRCEKQHRDPRTFLRCAIRGLSWVEGAGEYAVVAWCRTPTITLWPKPDLAHAALTELNALACGGRCTGRHEIVHIEIDTPQPRKDHAA